MKLYQTPSFPSAQLFQALGIELLSLRKALVRPLRPLWVTQESGLLDFSPEFNPQINDLDFYPVVCCMASRRVRGSEASESGYIQGAGDDSETWSLGLTPAGFWHHREELLQRPDGLHPGFIQDLMAVEKEHTTTNEISLVTLTKGIYLCTLDAARQAQGFDGIISCIDNTIPNHNAEANPAIHGKRLNLQCGSGKLGSRALRNQLGRIPPFITTLTPHTHVPRILFACSSGTDLAVGAALVVICLFINDNCK